MKRFIFCLCLLTNSVTTMNVVAAPPISVVKLDMMKKADAHKKEADIILKQIRALTGKYIPNPEDQSHMDALIAASIASARIKGPIQKLMAIALALFANVAKDCYHVWTGIRTMVMEVTYHLEMANFYDLVALRYSNANAPKDNDATKAFFQALDYLTACEVMCAATIQDGEVNDSSARGINKHRRRMIKHFEDKVIDARKIHKEALNFYENFHEIISELEDEDVANEILEYNCIIYEEILQACIEWGYDPYLFGEGIEYCSPGFIRLEIFREKLNKRLTEFKISFGYRTKLHMEFMELSY